MNTSARVASAFVLCVAILAQNDRADAQVGSGAPRTTVTGKWRPDSAGALPTTIDLKADGTTLTGRVIRTSVNGTVETADIYDGTIDGNTISFKYKSPAGIRTITLVGKVNGDEIAFTRVVAVGEGGVDGGAGIFGSKGSPTFTATRVKEVDPAPARDWLASHAVRLRTVEARNGFDDMQPLKQIVGNARLVELGEATHGTREFFQLKHRMLEFLVTQMDFTVFGIEATMPEAFAINDYVLTGKGDPARALAGLYFWIWNTEEVLEMIQWMRQYNADPKHVKKVKFYGFDMQSAPRAVKVTLAYLRKTDPDQAAATEGALAQLANPITEPEYINAPADRKAAAMAVIDAVLKRFDARKNEYIRKTSASEWAVARQHACIIAQNLEMLKGQESSSDVRDSSMAVNIRWILDHEGPETKMVVWAHNAHVATQYSTMMGGYLRTALGTGMVAFGFAFNEGSFQAREMTALGTLGALRQFTVGPAPAGSLDETLAAAGLRVAAIDLRALPKEGAVANWFATPRGTRWAGSAYSEQNAFRSMSNEVAPQVYDALLFVEATSAARPNKSGTPQAPQKLDKPTNLDFESGGSGVTPGGWITTPLMNTLGFESVTTGDQSSSGRRAVLLSRSAGNYYGESDGSVTQRIDATAYRGKHIKLRVMARSSVAGSGNHAYVRLRVTNPFGVGLFDNLVGQPVTSRGWQAYEVEADVPATAEMITYGVSLIGTGRVWMDAVSIEVIPNMKQGVRP